MAKANKQLREEQVTTTVEVERVVLELTQDEVDALYAVLMKVGGSPIHTGRKYTNNVLEALASHADMQAASRHKFHTPYSATLYFE